MVDFTDIKDVYNAKRHPDVLSGRRSEEAVLMEFLDTFDVGGQRDGCVTRDEFLSYYANVSASIDDDDYFELMIRNAWHISGGEGWCANTSNRRVLVTGSDGRESVQEVRNDLGVREGDSGEVLRRLRDQGADAVQVDATGKISDSAGGLLKGGRLEQGSLDSSRIGGRFHSGNKTTVTILNDRKDANLKNIETVIASHAATVDFNQELRDRKIEAVTLFSRGHYEDSEQKFLETIEFVRSFNPSHKEIIVLQRSADACQAKIKSVVGTTRAIIKTNQTAVRRVDHPLLLRLRKELFAKGLRGLNGLSTKFKQLDEDNSKTLSLSEFRKGLRDVKTSLIEREIMTLFAFIDRDGEGSISYDEFLSNIRGEISANRLSAVDNIFRKLDQSDSGFVSLSSIANIYNTSKHPDVLSGKATERTVLVDFLESLGSENIDGQVSKDGFVDYYSNLSAITSDDKEFFSILKNSWL